MVEWAIPQPLSYSPQEWLLFAAIAFLAAYLGGWIGMFIGHFVVAFVVLILHIEYATTHAYMDMDIVFTMGVLARVVLINTVLLPVGGLGAAPGEQVTDQIGPGPSPCRIPNIAVEMWNVD
jgi:membrane protein YqaA with SNARE-associated domain